MIPQTGSIPAAPRFRFNRTRGFWTYPQANDLTKEIIRDWYVAMDPTCKYLVSQELHQDGNTHFHVYIEFSKKLDKRDSRWNDINGRHPNDAGKVRNLEGVWTYIKKDGDYITNFVIKENPWAKAIKRAADGDPTGAFEIIKETNPKEACLRGAQIQQNLSLMSPKTNSLVGRVQRPFNNRPWREHPVMDQWFKDWVYPEEMTFDENGESIRDRSPCLFLIGPTCLGKTAWIRAKGNHLFYRNSFSLDAWTNNVDYIVFDDCDWKFVILGIRKTVLTGMGECVASDKYTRKMAIKCNRPAVWIANEEPRFESPGDEAYWHDPHNGVWVFVSEKMYE